MDQTCRRIHHNGKDDQYVSRVCVQPGCENRFACQECCDQYHKNHHLLTLDEFHMKHQSFKQQMDQLQKLLNYINEAVKGIQSLLGEIQSILFEVQGYADFEIQKMSDIVLNWILDKNYLTKYEIILTQTVCSIQRQQEDIQQIFSNVDSLRYYKPIKMPQKQSNWDIVTIQKPLVVETHHKIQSIALSPDGKYVATAGEHDFSIRIQDPSTGKQFGNDLLHQTKTINSIIYSPCGKYLVSGSADSIIRIFDLSTSNLKLELKAHTDSVTSVVYSDRFLISCSVDQTIRFWDPEIGQEYYKERIHDTAIYCLASSPIINTEIAFGDCEGKICIYDYQRLLFSQYQGNEACVNAIQYSSDGKFILSGRDDETIQLFEISSQENETIQERLGYVYTIGFSPNMQYIISGGYDKIVRLIDRNKEEKIYQITKHTDSVQSVQFSLDGRQCVIRFFSIIYQQNLLSSYYQSNRYHFQFLVTENQWFVLNCQCFYIWLLDMNLEHVWQE